MSLKEETEINSEFTLKMKETPLIAESSASSEITYPEKTPKTTFKEKNKTFYPTVDFPHMKVLNANYESIKKELYKLIELDRTLSSEDKFFQPWIEKDLYEESNPTGWDIGPLMIGGNYIEKNCQRASFLYELLKEIPGIKSASFSLLKPNTHIVPHQGYDEYSEQVLRYHLGLIIPKGDLGIRVAQDIKVWKEGESFIFDDFLIHEAWNFTTEDRYVLICDFAEVKETDNFKIKDINFNKSISNYIQN